MKKKSPFPSIHNFDYQIQRDDVKAMRKTLDRLDDEQRSRLLSMESSSTKDPWFVLGLKKGWNCALALIDYGVDVERRKEGVKNWYFFLKTIEDKKKKAQWTDKDQNLAFTLFDALIHKKMHLDNTEVEGVYNESPVAIEFVNFHKNNPELAKYFINQALDSGYTFHAPDSYGRTPFSFAVWRLDLEMIDFLLAQKVDVNPPVKSSSDSILHMVFTNHSEDKRKSENLEEVFAVLDHLDQKSGLRFEDQEILETTRKLWGKYDNSHPEKRVLERVEAYVSKRNMNELQMHTPAVQSRSSLRRM